MSSDCSGGSWNLHTRTFTTSAPIMKSLSTVSDSRLRPAKEGLNPSICLGVDSPLFPPHIVQRSGLNHLRDSHLTGRAVVTDSRSCMVLVVEWTRALGINAEPLALGRGGRWKAGGREGGRGGGRWRWRARRKAGGREGGRAGGRGKMEGGRAGEDGGRLLSIDDRFPARTFEHSCNADDI